MLTNGQYIARHGISFTSGLAAMAIGDIALSLGLLSAVAFPVVYYTFNKGILFAQQSKRSKELNLTRNQYLHIEEQLAIASKNANALTQKYVQVRSIKSFKVIYEMSKLSKRIISLVRKDPKKFYMIEDFFYAHLPSALELSDKYALLTKEQVTGTEIHVALNDTRQTLKQLYETMETDLKIALSPDIESLKLELDFAKLANEQRQNELKSGGDH